MNNHQTVFSTRIYKFLMPPSWLGASKQDVDTIIKAGAFDYDVWYFDGKRYYDAWNNPTSPGVSPHVSRSIVEYAKGDVNVIKEELALRAKHLKENGLSV